MSDARLVERDCFVRSHTASTQKLMPLNHQISENHFLLPETAGKIYLRRLEHTKIGTGHCKGIELNSLLSETKQQVWFLSHEQ